MNTFVQLKATSRSMASTFRQEACRPILRISSTISFARPSLDDSRPHRHLPRRGPRPFLRPADQVPDPRPRRIRVSRNLNLYTAEVLLKDFSVTTRSRRIRDVHPAGPPPASP